MKRRTLLIFICGLAAGFILSSALFIAADARTGLKNFVISLRAADTVKVPILMYHHFTEDIEKVSNSTITPDKFKSDLEALTAAGFNTVTFQDLIDYAHDGKKLPDNPVAITFDDGYLSFYEYAYPLLAEKGMKASASIIGVSAGKDKNANGPIIPHFSYEQAKEMKDSGLIDIVSHTYDLHGDGLIKLENESDSDFTARIKADSDVIQSQFHDNMGFYAQALVYPYGKASPLSEQCLKDLGYKATVIIGESFSSIIKNDPSSLYMLRRINVNQDLSGNDLINKIRGLI